MHITRPIAMTMEKLVCFFNELNYEQRHLAGGKGGTLAVLYQKGFPVPNGFIILPGAFEDDEMLPEVWVKVLSGLELMRNRNKEITFAVRSSAQSEDSSLASFAGQFDSVLNLREDHEIKKAILTVRLSRHNKEVRAYSEVKGLATNHDMAVVVQQMVPADIAGVLFTIDPITGSCDRMVGNYIFGIGENLVSGKTTPYSFTLERTNRKHEKTEYKGPIELKPFKDKLAKLGINLEKELGHPQDIEWAIAHGKLYLLQSRPVTTSIGYNPATGDWNDSLTGEYLWTNVNFGEAVPEVMTPLTWTVQQHIYESWKILPDYDSSGNICGHIYLNLSIYASVLKSLGKSKEGIIKYLEGFLYTRLPRNVEIPIIRLPRLSIFSFLLNFIKIMRKQRKAANELPQFLIDNPVWCRNMQQKIHETNDKNELASLWLNKISPHLIETVWSVMGSIAQYSDSTMKLRRKLIDLVGPEDADALVSGLSSTSNAGNDSGLLASLGIVVGIAKIARGELSRTEYDKQYGHRGPNEFELSVPRPSEDSSWMNNQLAQYERYPIDIEALLLKKREEIKATWERLKTTYPRQAKNLKKRIERIAPRARQREAVRSEYVRDRNVVRSFALRAGTLTNIGQDIFFLTKDEVMDVLHGKTDAVCFIPSRKETYKKYLALPTYPSIICGHFDPFQWVTDPDRRIDIYDASATNLTNEKNNSNENIIIGSPASAGRFEGIVRKLNCLEDGEQFQEGEILVTLQTDIAWTPLFPRAGAIITDIGAPLSHAAVVAREFGIPAVVGCSNATMRLNTGDRVLVDGGKGTVSILNDTDK